MSQEATYSTKIDTSLIKNSTTSLSLEIISMAKSIRSGVEDGIKYLDSIMKTGVDFPISVTDLKSAIIEGTMSLKGTDFSLSLNCNRENQAINENQLTSNQLNNLTQTIEKSYVDILTALTIKAEIQNGWEIVDSMTQINSQTIITQNREGTVMATQINPDEISIDISGLSSASCVKKAKEFLNDLNKLGLCTDLISSYNHNNKNGGTLLISGKNAISVNRNSEIKRKIKKTKIINIHIPINQKQNNNNKNYEGIRINK